MQYKKILEVLQQMTPEQLEQDAIILDVEQDEFFPVTGVGEEKFDDVLDKGHIFLKIK